MLKPFTAEQNELFFGKGGIEQRQGHAVKRQIPRREPRILPCIAHRDNVRGVEVAPLVVATVPALRRRPRLARIAAQPLLDVVVEELFGPQHAGEGLALHTSLVDIKRGRLQRCVELVGLIDTSSNQYIELIGRKLRRGITGKRAQAQA